MLPPQSPFGSAAVPAGALCPRHPATAAFITCGRCGNFMCEACSEGSRWTKCPGCREQEGTLQFPLTRDTWNFSNLWEHSASLFKPNWLMFSVAALIALVVSYLGVIPGTIAQFVFQATGMEEIMAVALAFPISLLGSVVQMVMALGLVRISLDVLQGRPVELGRLFSQWRRLPSVLGLWLLFILGMVVVIGLPAGLVVGIAAATDATAAEEVVLPFAFLGVLVLMIPILLASLAFYLALIGLVVQPQVGAVAQFRRSWTALRGQRLPVVGLLLLLGLLMMGGMMLCCVGYLPAYAFTMLVMTALYLALHNEQSPAALG